MRRLVLRVLTGLLLFGLLAQPFSSFAQQVNLIDSNSLADAVNFGAAVRYGVWGVHIGDRFSPDILRSQGLYVQPGEEGIYLQRSEEHPNVTGDPIVMLRIEGGQVAEILASPGPAREGTDSLLTALAPEVRKLATSTNIREWIGTLRSVPLIELIRFNEDNAHYTLAELLIDTVGRGVAIGGIVRNGEFALSQIAFRTPGTPSVLCDYFRASVRFWAGTDDDVACRHTTP